MSRSILSHRGLLLLCALFALPALASAAEPAVGDDPTRLVELRSLHYGEVLFHHYQDSHFDALVYLRAAEFSQRLGPHREQAALLDGALSLAYRMPDVAEARFRSVLDQRADDDIHQRAWMGLGKLQHRRGQPLEALDALDRAAAVEVQGAPASRRAELRLLRARLEQALGRPQRAATLLEEWLDAAPGDADEDPSGGWQPYAQYNLAAARQALGDAEGARAALRPVIELTPYDPELYALVDRARLGLGLELLRDGQPQAAAEQLAGVRLRGPFSTPALLAAGWALAEGGEQRAARRHWRALTARPARDAAVQEGLLAVAWASVELGEHGAALDGYRRAIERFDAEAAALDAAGAALDAGGLSAALAAIEPRRGHRVSLPSLASSPPGSSPADQPAAAAAGDELLPYLREPLAEHVLRSALADYRDLLALGDNLDHWAASMEAFDSMLADRRLRYAQHRPAAAAALAEFSLDGLRARRDQLQRRYAAAIAATGAATGAAADPGEVLAGDLALAEPQRRRRQAQLDDAQRRLDALRARGAPEQAATQERIAQLQRRLRLLRGLQLWQLSAERPQRQQLAGESLQALDAALAQSTAQRDQLAAALGDGQSRFSEQGLRIVALGEQLAALQLRLATLRERQRARLDVLVGEELAHRRLRLNGNRQLAQLALAQAWDRAADAVQVGESGGEPAAGERDGSGQR